LEGISKLTEEKESLSLKREKKETKSRAESTGGGRKEKVGHREGLELKKGPQRRSRSPQRWKKMVGVGRLILGEKISSATVNFRKVKQRGGQGVSPGRPGSGSQTAFEKRKSYKDA